MEVNIDSLPMELLSNIALQLDNTSFTWLAGVNRACNSACHVAKFPLNEVALHTTINTGTEICVSVIDTRYFHTPSATFIQESDSTVRAHFYIQEGEERSELYEYKEPTQCHVPAMEYFAKLLAEYRVNKISIDLYKLEQSTPLLKSLLQRLKLRCSSLEVGEATLEQLYLLTDIIRADDYHLKFANYDPECPEKILPLSKNLCLATGSVSAHSLSLGPDVASLRCTDLKTDRVAHVSLSLISDWAENWARDLPFCKQAFEFRKTLLEFREVERFVRKQRNRFTHFEQRRLSDGSTHFRMAVGYVGANGQLRLLEFSNSPVNDGQFSVRFHAISRY